MSTLRTGVLLALAAAAALLGTVGCAQTQVYTSRVPAPPPGMAETPPSDVPGARIGRVAELVGAAQAWDAEQRAWVPLFLNRAVTAGDRVRTEAGSRVEVQIGSLRVFVGPSSDMELPALEESRTMIRLVSGSLAVQLRQAAWARSLELLTDELRLQPLGVGLFRLDRDLPQAAGPVGAAPGTPAAVSGVPVLRSSAVALQGLLRVNHPAPRFELRPGQRVDAVAGQPSIASDAVAGVAPDSFALWLAALDEGAAAPTALAPPLAAEVPVEWTGMDGLERHGRWDRHPEYGIVWWPTTVRAGWEPYRHGRWVWVRPGGWVWWEDAPWGFAPYHYGRWVYWSNRWVWAPRLPRPHPPVVGAPVGGAPVVPRSHPPGVIQPVIPPGASLRPVPEVRDPREERVVRTPRWERRVPSEAGEGGERSVLPAGSGQETKRPPGEAGPRDGGIRPILPREVPRTRVEPPAAGRERPDRERSERERQERERKPAL